MVRLGVGDGLGRDGLLGEKSGLAAPRFFTASSKNNRPGSRASANLASARQGATACEKGASEEMPFVASSVHAIMVVVVMVMMAMGSRPDADVNASSRQVIQWSGARRSSAVRALSVFGCIRHLTE